MLNKSLKELLEHYRNHPELGKMVMQFEQYRDKAEREYIETLADIQRDFYRAVEDHIEEEVYRNRK